MKRCIALMLILCMALTVFSGCSSKQASVENSDEKVELTWVFGGPGKLEDSDRVWAAFNEKLQEYLPNTTVKFIVIPHSDYEEKWKLMSASQEDMDIVWISWALNFADEVSKGSYLDITELVEKYGQDMVAGFPDWLLKLTSVDNKIYAIPNYQMMASKSGFSVEKPHVDKGWFDIDAAEELFAQDKVLTKDDYKMFESYFEKVLASGEDIKYMSSFFLERGLKQKIGIPVGGLEDIICNAAITKAGDDYKVYDKLVDFPESDQYYDLINEWYNKGYIRKDIIENPTEKAGEYLLWQTSIMKGSAERASLMFERPMEVFASDNNIYIPYNGVATSTAISANSKHPERAMQLLNLMNSEKGKDLLNLLSYGFEGEHYNKISEDRIEWLGKGEPGSAENKYGYQNWALGNALVTYTTQHDPEGWNEYQHEELNMKAEMSRLAGFTLDLKPIKFEVAQYNAVMKEYEYLDKGTTPNYKEVLAERNEKLKKAGSEKIVAEVQKQVDEWVKSNKK